MSSSYKRGKFIDDHSTNKHADICRLGKPIQLISNHFKIDLSKCLIYRYNIKILNADKSRKGKLLLSRIDKIWYETYFEIINQLVNNNCSPGQQFYDDTYQTKIAYAFDGNKSLYTCRKLRENEFKSTCDYRFNQFEFNLKISITFSKELDLDRFQDYFSGNSENLSELLQALETILKEGPISNGLPINRGIFPRFNEEEKINENDVRCIDVKGLRKKVVFGHTQTIQVMQRQLNLVVDREVHAFYIGEMLDKALISILTRSTSDERINIGQILFSLAGNDLRKRQEYTNQLSNELKGIMIETTHLNYRRRYKVFDITNEPIRQLTFKDRNSGTDRNVCDYYRTTYGLRLNGALPCINVGNERSPIYLPFEVCRIMLNQKANKLRFQETQNLIQFSITNQKIENRFEFIKEKVNSINESSVQKMKNIISLNVNPIEINAVQLLNPKLQFKNIQNFQPNYGKWKMNGKEVIKGENLLKNELCVANLTEKLTLNQIDQFLRLMIMTSEKIGIRIEEPFNFNRNCGNENSFFCETREQLKEIMNGIIRTYSIIHSSSRKPKLILFFIGRQRGDQIYKNIKSESELNYGLRTQCITEQNVHKILDYFYNKSATSAVSFVQKFNERISLRENGEYILNTFLLKINSKLGGINCTVNSVMNKISTLKDDLLIIGADVTHATQKEFKYSICSLVSSLDRDHFKYTGVVRIQEKALEEIIKKMDVMMIEILELFVRNKLEENSQSVEKQMISDYDSKKIYNMLPKHIVYYRDGISEGQYDDFKKNEIKSMTLAFKEYSRRKCFEQTYKPRITAILCMKRHTTRFMKKDDKDENMNSYEASISTSINQPNYSHDYLNLSEKRQDTIDENSEPIQTFNINPGTLINNEKIVKTDREFYLCSHNCNQGTVRSTHYYVIINECNFHMNDIQRFTYDMCYLFGKGTKSVSIPAPVKYAHSAAYRARQHLAYSDDTESISILPQPLSFQQSDLSPKLANIYPPFANLSSPHLPNMVAPFPNFQPPPFNQRFAYQTPAPLPPPFVLSPSFSSIPPPPFSIPPPFAIPQKFSMPQQPQSQSKPPLKTHFKKKAKNKNEHVTVNEQTQKKIQVKDDLKLSFYFL